MTVGTEHAALGYFSEQVWPTPHAVRGDVKLFIIWIQVIKSQGCGMIVVATFLTASSSFIPG